MTLPSKQLAIAQALATWLNSLPAVASLGTARIDRSMAKHPRYPTDPVADCPLLLVQINVARNQLAISHGRETVYDYSLWHYRLQTVGADNTTAFGTAMATLESAILTDARPTIMQLATADLMTPGEAIYHEEMDHPLSGEPRLRVSVGEIRILVQSKSVRS